MKEGELRALFEEECPAPVRNEDGRINVLVRLHNPEPSMSLLAHLKVSGLTIDRVIGSTLLGSILPDKAAELQLHKEVRAVEPAVLLRPHQP